MKAYTALSIISLLAGTNAFNINKHVVSRPPAPRILSHMTSFLQMVKSSSMPDEEELDEEGNVVRIPVKNIERDWTWTKGDIVYKADGDFKVDLFLNEDPKKIKGVAFFMHGFSQYPIAYRDTLKKAAEKADVAIIAVKTGIGSKIVLGGIKDKPKGVGREWMQVVLQRAVSEDTKQCIKMVLDGDDVFEEYGVTASAVKGKMAVMGHSMGGGLCLPVAKDFPKDIDHVFAMAPAYGVEGYFDPLNDGVRKHTATNNMLLAGGWDLVAPASKVSKIAAVANKKVDDSAIYVEIKQGLHVGFQDRVVLLSTPLATGLPTVILGFVEFFKFKILRLFLFVFRFNKKRTGQLAGTRVLMDYFLNSMVEGKKTRLDEAEKYLDDNLKDKYENNFVFSYPKETK